MKFQHLLLLAFACSIRPAAAQEFYRRYATQPYMRALQTKDPGLAERRSAIERFTADYQSTGLPEAVSVAVVFHIVSQPGKNKIKNQDIEGQLERLNRDFFMPAHPKIKHKADTAVTEAFLKRSGRPMIRFCMAAQMPNGSPATGLVFVNSPKTEWSVGSDSLYDTALGGSTAWDTERYLNIWIVPLADDLAGYAQMPGGPAASDGIVLNADFFAKSESLQKHGFDAAITSDKKVGHPKDGFGRSLSHLIGSYLNLYELWNDEQPCADDYVWDTPVHNAPNYGRAEYRHVSLCDENYPVEMTMNLMDNTDDVGQYLLTIGQSRRMQATLAPGGPRSKLRETAGNCAGKIAERSENLPVDRSTESAWAAAVRVFPNPSTGDFYVEFKNEAAARVQVSAFNSIGQLMFHRDENAPAGGMQLQLAARDWAPGVYVVRVVADGVSATKVVEKQKI
jgi:Secretion system C-terminal sorting domain